MNILIVRFSALGDVTLVIPAVRQIQRSFPNCNISWLTSPQSYSLLRGLSGVEFIVTDKPTSVLDYYRVYKLFANKRFDILLAMQASLRINLVYPLIRASRKIGFDKIRARDGQYLFSNERIDFRDEHLLDSFRSFAAKIGAENGEPQWGLDLPSGDVRWAENIVSNLSTPLVAINPFSSKMERNWLPERYVDLIAEIRKRWNADIVLTGGSSPLEAEVSEGIARQLDFPVTNLVGSTTPKQLAALLSMVSCLIAPDTGPVHIATAVGTPVIGLYAVAPPGLTGAYLSRKLWVNKYPEAVETILHRDPRKLPWNTRVHRGDPMSLISTRDVLEKLRQLLDQP